MSMGSPARASIDVGSVIGDTYTIEALIGRGGMGAVFQASHNRLPGKKVAIKLLHADISGDDVLARFKREAQIASLLSHPNIVHIEDYNVTADGTPYLVMENLSGESLADRLRRGPVPLDQTFSIIRQVGSALAAAHAKGIVHRDLKPQNIFLVPSEIDGQTREIAKVLDFGISKMRDSQTVKTQETALLGTPQYMAPEQATGQHDKVDARTDVFALGAIVYEMLSATPAFSGQTIPEVVFKVVYEQPVDLATRVPTLSQSVITAVRTAMAKSADDRYPTVSSFLEALTGSPVSVMRRATPRPPDDDASGSAIAQTAPSNPPGAQGLAATVASQSGTPSAQAGATVSQTAPATAQAGATVSQTAPATSQRGTTASPSAPAMQAGPTPSQSAAAPSQAGPTPSQSAPATSPAGATVSQSVPGVLSTASATSVVPVRRRFRALIAVAVVAAAAAAAAVVLVSSSDKEPSQVARSQDPDRVAPSTTPPPSASDRSAPAAGVTPETARADESTNADDKTSNKSGDQPGDKPNATPNESANDKANDNRRTGAQPARTKTAAKPPNEPAKPTENVAKPADSQDSHAGAKLLAAEQALRAEQWADAERHANAVLNAEDARPRQKSAALVVHAIARCHEHNDQGAALTAMRVLERNRLLKRAILLGCQDAGLFKDK